MVIKQKVHLNDFPSLIKIAFLWNAPDFVIITYRDKAPNGIPHSL